MARRTVTRRFRFGQEFRSTKVSKPSGHQDLFSLKPSNVLTMYLSRVVLAISCILLQIIPEVSCDGHLGTVDYIAIAVSLGMAMFILAAIVFFLWRSRNRSEMNANNPRGRNNPAVTGDNEGDVRGISMSQM